MKKVFKTLPIALLVVVLAFGLAFVATTAICSNDTNSVAYAGDPYVTVYSFPYEDNAALLQKGLIKEVKTKIAQPVADGRLVLHSVDVAEADRDMTDEVAATYIVDDIGGKVHSGKKGIINIDVLSANFNDGDTVDIEALWAKKLIPASVGQVKLLAKGTLDKALNVDLQDYSLQAVKMIVLVGGTVRRAK